MNIFGRTIDRRIAAGSLSLLVSAIGAVTPARAIMNGSGQDIFPVTSVFQSSVAITYSNAANAGLIVSSGLIVSNGDVGISTGAPQARLDVLASSSTADTMAQIWRDSNGMIISSVSATGVMTAVKFLGGGPGITGIPGDNLGNHTAARDLDMAGNDIVGVSTISVSSITAPGAGVLFSTNVFVMKGRIGIGTTAPVASLGVAGTIKIGNVAADCAPALAGTLRWAGGYISVCNGSDWRPLENQLPPAISAISPLSGPDFGGTVITISGAGFTPGSGVSVGGAAATAFTWNSPAQITATTPAGSVGAKEVKIVNLDGQYSVGTFTYNPTPTIASVSPASGLNTGGTAITITGTNFAAGAAVLIGGAAATGVTVVSDTQITATTPAGSGANDVRVTNPDGGTTALTGGFTYGISATGGTVTYPTGYTVHTFTAGGTFTVTGTGNVEVLIVAGGGGGGKGAGGGAGGVYYSASMAVAAGDKTVVVGAGGAANTKGGNSSFNGQTAEGGGYGGIADQIGGAGGCGGGGGMNSGFTSFAGGAGSQGYKGGTTTGIANSPCGGGGGMGSAGQDGPTNGTAGNGGSGVAYTIYDGTTRYYAGGGGGGAYSGYAAGTGQHGGGNGLTGTGAGTGGAGTANTGGGGGGGPAGGSGGAGGSGIVIIRYLR